MRYRRGQFDGLHPESHVAFFQDLVVELVFERDDCRDGRGRTIRTEKKKTTKKAGLMGRCSLGCLMEWLSSSMVFRAVGQEATNMSSTRSGELWCYVHRLYSPSSVSVWLEETPSVSVTTTEYWPRSSLSGLVKVSLELRIKVQTLETHIHLRGQHGFGKDTLVLPSASLRPSLCRHRHPGAVANWLVVLGPHKLGSLADLTGFKGQKDVPSVLVHTGHNLLCACLLNQT